MEAAQANVMVRDRNTPESRAVVMKTSASMART
jgi:hypothetical protein